MNHRWWYGACIYQIYPRSFMDSNSDGVGDLPGIIEKLDYIASLGVDAVWISPFFKSPMKDFGYDISDYRAIDPLFGTLEDFDRLMANTHARGIRVIIDQVLSHTSDQHWWFQQSRQSRDNPKADWYVWADAKDDGTPPNNWLSIFGGSAWQWEPRRKQYYLHNFLSSQPDLNFHNPAVVDQMLDEVEFWLQRGVDGIRLDAINFCFHDKQLRDNPPKPEHARRGRGFSPDNPYAFQYHCYDNTQPENVQFLERLRCLLDRYPDVVTLGEISSEDSLQTIIEYTEGDRRLHMAYSFELLTDDFSLSHIRQTVERVPQTPHSGLPCWSVGNHDVSRVATRWGNGDCNQKIARLLNAFLLSLRGCICSYQGEELGLPEADIPYDRVQDPYGTNFWPMFKGRDGCRTPMPWNHNQTALGFSFSCPWLPIPEQHRVLAVDVQEGYRNSTLNAFRAFVRWRKRQPALRFGDMEFIDSPADTLCFLRRYECEQILAYFNFSVAEVTVNIPFGVLEPLYGHGFSEAVLQGNTLTLPGYGAFFGGIPSPEPMKYHISGFNLPLRSEVRG